MNRLFGMLSSAALIGQWLVLAIWLASRIVTDRFHVAQFPWWVPSWIFLPAAGALWLIARMTYRRPRGRRRPALPLGAGALALGVAWFGVVECRVYRLAGRDSTAEATAQPGGLRILFWNPSVDPNANVAKSMNLVQSDLAIMANPTWNKPFNEMAERFAGSSFVMADQFIVLSRSSVRRWGATELGLSGRIRRMGDLPLIPGPPTGRLDPGRACWLEIDTTALFGRPIIVWVLDLPSDEQLSRWETAGEVISRLRAWAGPAVIPDGRGGIVGTEPMTGFPTPDIVMGDLNSPRGSASLTRLAPEMHNAFDEGGAGCVATFPRTLPLVHIDHVLIAPWLHCDDYRTVDPGVSRHLMVWARIRK